MTNTPENLPKPTYWPFFFGLAVTTIAWGLITSWVVIAVGGLVLLAAVIGWMRDLS